MNQTISSVKLQVSAAELGIGNKLKIDPRGGVYPVGAKVWIDLTTLNPGGHDTGEDAVLNAGLAFMTGFDVVFVTTSGEVRKGRLYGNGGTFHLANPGYIDEAPEGLNFSTTPWINSNGHRPAIKNFDTPGKVSVKAFFYSVPGVTPAEDKDATISDGNGRLSTPTLEFEFA